MALASASTSTNLSVTVAHAITFLTRPLIASHSATAIMKLQLILEAHLTALYAPTWVVKDPLRGSGRRCLTLSPDCLPPRVIYNACIAAGIQWHDWISALGNREFNLFVDPGCVSVRYGSNNTLNNKFVTVWADEIASPAPVKAFFDPAPVQQSKTLAQQLLEDDHEDDQLFYMIAREIDDPTWTTPIEARFSEPVRSFSPLSTISGHSRPSSRSSNSSSVFSLSGSSTTSLSTPSSTPSPESRKQSRRERARQGRVFVDTSKTEVTPYDGGKTTVLTGGVMLGGMRAAKAVKVTKPSSGNWRSTTI